MTVLDHRRRAPAPPGRFDRSLIPPMILGSILNPVNSSMLAVALVPIGIAFGAPPSETVWLVSALYLATAVGQPVVGRLVDMFGPRRLYLVGTAVVGVAGLLGALAPNLGTLVAARVLLGLGTCAGYPAAMSLVRSESRRTGIQSPSGVLAALAVSNQVVAVIGPTLGGLLVGVGGWRTIFTVNVPLSVACLVLGSWRLPRTAGTRRAPLDLPGMALFAVTLTALLLWLMDLRLDRWWLLVVTALAATALVLRERRVTEPFLDVRVLAGNGPLVRTYVRMTLTTTVTYAFLYGFTQWLEASRGLTPAHAGLVLLPMSATAIVVTTLVGRTPQVRGKLLVGASVQVAACAMLLLADASSAIVLLVAVTVAVGVPQGLNGLANQNALYHQAEPARIASSAGLLRTAGYLGAMAASAGNAAAFAGGGADDAGLHGLALFLVVVSVLLLALTVADRTLARVGRPLTA